MADLATARTRLGLWGHATRPGNFGLPAVAGSAGGPTGAFVTTEDAVVTLLAAVDAVVTLLAAVDAVVTRVTAADA